MPAVGMPTLLNPGLTAGVQLFGHSLERLTLFAVATIGHSASTQGVHPTGLNSCTDGSASASR